MPRSKTRNKTYKPRQIKTPSILDNLPLPETVLKKLTDEMNKSILRLRLSGNNGQDLSALVMFFAVAWLLAAQMQECIELRTRIENDVHELSKAVLANPKALPEQIFALLADLVDITTAVISESTKKEYRDAGERLKTEGAVPFADDFLVTLAQADILEIIDTEEPCTKASHEELTPTK